MLVTYLSGRLKPKLNALSGVSIIHFRTIQRPSSAFPASHFTMECSRETKYTPPGCNPFPQTTMVAVSGLASISSEEGEILRIDGAHECTFDCITMIQLWTSLASGMADVICIRHPRAVYFGAGFNLIRREFPLDHIVLDIDHMNSIRAIDPPEEPSQDRPVKKVKRKLKQAVPPQPPSGRRIILKGEPREGCETQ